jgi:hypothetical protein
VNCQVSSVVPEIGHRGCELLGNPADSTNGLVFPDLNSAPFGGEAFQTNLIMPEPCPFPSPSLPVCSITRPTETNSGLSANRSIHSDAEPPGHKTKVTACTGWLFGLNDTKEPPISRNLSHGSDQALACSLLVAGYV